MRLKVWAAVLTVVFSISLHAQSSARKMEVRSTTVVEKSIALPPLSAEGTLPVGGSQSSPPAAPDLPPPSEADDRSRVQYMGSTYVPVDSWVYPVIERLAALNYVQSASVTVRPWTRLQAARLVEEAHAALDEDGADAIERVDRIGRLDREFAPEIALLRGGRNVGATVDSVYSRTTAIGGTPLRDSFHFSQTIVDDFGRPYGKGLNAFDGVSGRAAFGPFAIYVRGEYQHSAGLPAYTPFVQQAISAVDRLPIGAGPTFPTVDRPRPVEAYVSLNLHDWQLSFGQQSLWWGPGRSNALLISNNAEAMPMLRLDRSAPLDLPWVLHWLGPIRFNLFLARTGGVHYVRLSQGFVLHGSPTQSLNPQPYLWGTKISVEPTPNLEFGAALTVVFAGYGRPLTVGTFLHTLSTSGNGQAVDPGDRRTQFDFTYRLPGLRNWLALYAEGLAEDEPIPLLYPRRSAMAPGVYLPQLPGLRKLDLRAEAVYTNLPNLRPQDFFYTNLHYANGYSNYGQIIGSWVGPQGIGWQATSTYWMSQRNTITATYRRHYTDKGLLEGGNSNDFSATFSWVPRSDIEVSGQLQYERWNFPILAPGARSDVSTSIEIRFVPKPKIGR